MAANLFLVAGWGGSNKEPLPMHLDSTVCTLSLVSSAKKAATYT